MIALRPMRAGAVLSILPFFVPPTDRSRTSHTSPDTTHRLRLAEVTSHNKQLVRQGRSERGEGGSRRRGQSGYREWRGTRYNVLIRGRVSRPPRESDPPGVTPAGAVNHMTHELFFPAATLSRLSKDRPSWNPN